MPFESNYKFLNILQVIQSHMNQDTPLLTFIHFNDVYDIQPDKNGKAGIVNFEAYVRKIKAQFPTAIVLFSGDAFSPSTLSNIFHGDQMTVSLNKLNIDVACMGNHEFDLQKEKTEELFNRCNFPWLQGNITFIKSGQFLGKGQPYMVKQVNGRRIGFIGVAGEDWIGILGDEYQDELAYEDANQFTGRTAEILRKDDKCELVVALTHMRVPQDTQLPAKCDGIDIVLGGHDHIILQQCINSIPVVKSGSNFRHLSVIHVYQKDSHASPKYRGHRYDFDITLHVVPIMEQGVDEELKKYVGDCMTEYAKFDRLIGYTDVWLDTRFSRVRSMETNYANFLTDLVRNYFDTDCCVLNSGCIRNDALIKPGKVNFSMISNLIDDVLVVKEVPGKVLLEALEYGVSNLPDSYAGSFLIVSGIKFTFDYRKDPKVQSVSVRENPLELQHKYSVAMKNYISTGGDGFSMFKECPYISDESKGIATLSLLLKFFKASETDYQKETVSNLVVEKKIYPAILGAIIDMMKENKQAKKEEKEEKEEKEGKEEKEEDRDSEIDDEIYEIPDNLLFLSRRMSTKVDRISKLRRKSLLGPGGAKFICIAPRLDGRIRSLAQEQKIMETQLLPF